MSKGRPVAHYRCRACRHEWHQPAGPTQCPKCEHLWVDWLNYDALVKKDRLP